MTAFEIEEEINTLSYIIDAFHTNISYLEMVSFNDNRYNLYVAQITEMCINLESRLDELESQLDEFSKEELQESIMERLKRDSQYNEIKKQGD